MKNTIAITGLALLISTAANAAIFDFESETETSIGGIPVGAYTSLSILDDGLEMTIYRSSGAAFDIVDLSSFGAPFSWGSRSFDPFINILDFSDTIVINFDSDVVEFSMSLGDFGADDDFIDIVGYAGLDGMGAVVESSSDILVGVASDFEDVTMSLNGTLRSVVITIGVDFPSSLFIDNIGARIVPAPSALALLGLGLLGGTRRRRN